MKIITDYQFPPIPIRNFDWVAYYEDADEETGPQGWGSTEQQAINNLINTK